MVTTEEEAYATHNKDMETVETTYLQNIAIVVERLWSLSDELLFKYASSFVNTPDDMSQMVGYPAWWLQAVGYEQGPPPPPTKPKCCHPTSNQDDADNNNMEEPMLTGKAAMK